VDLQAGSSLGDYEILGHLGSGGAGTVYRVRHSVTDRIEAIKILHEGPGDTSAQLERFMREIRVQASLQHPNIAGVHNAQQIDGRLVMAMEYVEGRNLREIIDRGPMAIAEAVKIAVQVLDGLRYAHEQGLIHRDVKPENILVTRSGEVKITDFGLVKAVQRKELTATGTPMGSMWYIAPEQVRSPKEVDARADIYSLGAVLYEMVTGRPPFPGDNFYELMRAHVEQTPCAPRGLRSDLSKELNAVIVRALEKDPERRFGSAAEFQVELRLVPPTSVSATQVRGFVSPRESASWIWSPAALASIGLLVALALATAGAALMDFPPAEQPFPEPPQASPAAGIRPPGFAYRRTPETLDSVFVGPVAPPPPTRRKRPRPKKSPAPAPPPVETPKLVANLPKPSGEHVSVAPLPKPVPVVRVAPELDLLRTRKVGKQMRRVIFGPRGRRLAALGLHSVKVWDVGSGNLMLDTGNLSERLTAVAFAGGSQALFTGDENGTVRVWNLNAGKEVAALGHSSAVTALAAGGGGRTLLVSLRDKTIHIWRRDPADGRFKREKRSLKRRSGPPRALAYSRDSYRIVATAGDNQIQMWRTIGSRKPTTIATMPGGATDLALNAGGALLAAAGPSGVGVWQVSTRRRLASLPTGATDHALAFVASGRCIAAAGGGQTVRVWDVLARAPVVEAVTRSVVADVAMTHDTRRVAALDRAGVLYLWQLNEPALELTQRPVEAGVLPAEPRAATVTAQPKRGILHRLTDVFR